VLDGAVIAQCKPRHRHQEFLAFLRHIEANVPAQLDVHLVVDNYATHYFDQALTLRGLHERAEIVALGGSCDDSAWAQVSVALLKKYAWRDIPEQKKDRSSVCQ
jgi:hypothetical protein